ncbi:MAG: hypothetical protein WKG06_07215 [Segetibacter sp.]
MKKIYALFNFCFFITVFAQAQFEKGQKAVGGNIGFAAAKSENVYSSNYTSDYSNLSVSPSVGLFSRSNLLCGIGLLYVYNYQKNKNFMNTDDSKTWNHSIGIDLFSQRFFTLAQKFFFTINTSGGLSYSFGKQISTTNNIKSEAKSSGYGIGVNLAPGLSYRLTPRFLFDAYLSNLINISYSHNQTKGKNEAATDMKSSQNSFNLSSSLSNTSLGNVGLGFRWLLRRK